MSLKTTALKWVFIFLIFFVTILAALAPIQIKRCRGNAKILGIMNTFSGGVFLAIAFAHILPEAGNLYYGSKLYERVEDDTSEVITKNELKDIIEDYTGQFPLPFVFVVCGYAFILLIDRVIIDSHSDIGQAHNSKVNSD